MIGRPSLVRKAVYALALIGALVAVSLPPSASVAAAPAPAEPVAAAAAVGAKKTTTTKKKTTTTTTKKKTTTTTKKKTTTTKSTKTTKTSTTKTTKTTKTSSAAPSPTGCVASAEALPLLDPKFMDGSLAKEEVPSVTAERWRNITYNMGAPVLTGNTKIYMIYYGNWTASHKSLADDFVAGFGNSSWYATNNKYYYQANAKAAKVYVAGASLGGSVVDAYSRGANLSGNAIPSIIEAHITAGTLPLDPKGVYMLALSKDVKEAMRADLGGWAMCDGHCGYHASWVLPCTDKRIFYGLVFDTDACPVRYDTNVCARIKQGPNDVPGLDNMFSLLANNVVRTVTDPYNDVPAKRAWLDSNPMENASKCLWSFGNYSVLPNGVRYNMVLGERRFMIQQNWDPEVQKCSN